MTLTPEQLAVLREAAERMQAKAPGPWYTDIDDAEECGPHSNSGLSKVESGSSGADWTIARLCETTEANYIAAFDPTACAELIRRVLEAEAEVGRLTKENELLKSIQSAYENGDEELLEELESEQP